MNYTTIEQSKKLLELGLSSESADMFWFRDDTEIPRVFPKDMMHDSASVTYPCWSIEALLKLLQPNANLVCERKQYFVIYRGALFQGSTYNYDSPIDALVEMVSYLLENNYLKTEKQYDTRR